MTILLNILLLVLAITFVTYSSLQYIKQAEVFHKIYFYVFLGLHFGLALFHWYWSFENGVDVIDFYNRAALSESWFGLFGTGSTFVRFLIYFFVKLGVNYSVLFFLFSVVSYYGFLNYFKLLQIYVVNKWQKLLYVLFLLPSFHFWSAPISKDSLVFFLMSVLLVNIRKQNYLILPLLFVSIGCIRPHVLVMLLLAFILMLFFEEKINKKHIIIGVLGLAIGGLVMLNFINLSEYTLDAIYLKLEQFNNYGLTYGKSHLDIFKTSYLERIFALLFRPLFVDAKTLFQYIVSLENIIVLFTLVYALIKMKLNNLTQEAKYALFASLFLLLLLGMYIYNLGLASRMRLMFLPYLFYGLCVGLNRTSDNEKAD